MTDKWPYFNVKQLLTIHWNVVIEMLFKQMLCNRDLYKSLSTKFCPVIIRISTYPFDHQISTWMLPLLNSYCYSAPKLETDPPAVELQETVNVWHCVVKQGVAQLTLPRKLMVKKRLQYNTLEVSVSISSRIGGLEESQPHIACL